MLLETLFLLISIFLATLGSFTFWPVNGWIDIYRPLVLFIATYLGCMVLTWTIYEISTLYVKKDKVYELLLSCRKTDNNLSERSIKDY